MVVGFPDQKAQVSWGAWPMFTVTTKLSTFSPYMGGHWTLLPWAHNLQFLGTQNAIFKQFSICLCKCNLVAEWSVQLMHCFMLVLVIWCGDTYWHLLWIWSVPARIPPILVFYWSNLVSLFIVLLCGGWGPSEDCWRHQWDRKTRGRVTIVGSRCQKERSSILLLF